MGSDGQFSRRCHDRGNTHSVIEFVQNIYEAYGRALLIMDNASYRHSKGLIKHIKAYDGDAKIVYQPPYSPDLNPVEMVWKELKKYIANGTYRRADDMTGAMDDMMQDGTVMVPGLPGYAPDASKHGHTAKEKYEIKSPRHAANLSSPL